MIRTSTSILIIEDQQEICDLIELSLSDKVPTIYFANSLAQACHLYANHTFDIAIVDICLPDGDPYVLVEKLSEKNCQIILMSGNFDLNQRLTQLPFQRIDKPFRIKTLLEAVETACKIGTPEAIAS
ncbi:response regulator [Commensalibacter oyaizuii]|uniref:Response regulator n=1 Tax=Commensalibacter oyaizuii TaxID=3043873 RepID=A0ABT6Q0V1_9PROT|nr:response regulator [Commensalibacter sp. TBRC 16381]MDI2090732.1 response regulator [Commensalibacter sp. TBRC 16381]